MKMKLQWLAPSSTTFDTASIFGKISPIAFKKAKPSTVAPDSFIADSLAAASASASTVSECTVTTVASESYVPTKRDNDKTFAFPPGIVPHAAIASAFKASGGHTSIKLSATSKKSSKKPSKPPLISQMYTAQAQGENTKVPDDPNPDSSSDETQSSSSSSPDLSSQATRRRKKKNRADDSSSESQQNQQISSYKQDPKDMKSKIIQQTTKGLVQELLKNAISGMNRTFAGETKSSDPIQIGVQALKWLHFISLWWEQTGDQAFQGLEEPAIEIIKSKVTGSAKTNLQNYYDEDKKKIRITSFKGLAIWLRKTYIRHECYPTFKRQIENWNANKFLLETDPPHACVDLDRRVRLYNILLESLPDDLKKAHTITVLKKFDIAKRVLKHRGTLETIHTRLPRPHNKPESYEALMISLNELKKDNQWLKDQTTLSTVAQYDDPTRTSAGRNVYAFQANTRQTYFSRRNSKRPQRRFNHCRRNNYSNNRQQTNNKRNRYQTSKKPYYNNRNRYNNRSRNNYRRNNYRRNYQIQHTEQTSSNDNSQTNSKSSKTQNVGYVNNRGQNSRNNNSNKPQNNQSNNKNKRYNNSFRRNNNNNNQNRNNKNYNKKPNQYNNKNSNRNNRNFNRNRNNNRNNQKNRKQSNNSTQFDNNQNLPKCSRCASSKVHAHWCPNLGKPITTITLENQSPVVQAVQQSTSKTLTVQSKPHDSSPARVRFTNSAVS